MTSPSPEAQSGRWSVGRRWWNGYYWSTPAARVDITVKSTFWLKFNLRQKWRHYPSSSTHQSLAYILKLFHLATLTASHKARAIQQKTSVSGDRRSSSATFVAMLGYKTALKYPETGVCVAVELASTCLMRLDSKKAPLKQFFLQLYNMRNGSRGTRSIALQVKAAAAAALTARLKGEFLRGSEWQWWRRRQVPHGGRTDKPLRDAEKNSK